jgi:internalin A
MKKIILSLILVITLLVTGCSNSNEKIIEEIDPNQLIEIKDSELERMIRDKVSKPTGDILASDMTELYSININYEEYAVKSIEGLEYATELIDLSYRYGEGLESLEPIAYSKTIESLNISYSTVENTAKTFNTPALTRISFIDTNISNCDFLKKSTNIKELTINNSNLESLEFMTDFKDLESLYLDYNNISDITPVENKKKLKNIKINNNEVSDISVLQSCINLETINISYNHVRNIEYLIGLEKLYELTAWEDLDQKIIPRSQIKALIESGISVLYHE